MKQQVDLAGAGGTLDLVGAGKQRTAARLEAEPVERGLAKRTLDPLAKVSRNIERGGLERAGQGALELALGVGSVERASAHPDPRATPRRPRADIGRDLAVRAKREPDQRITRALSTGQDAGANRVRHPRLTAVDQWLIA